MNLYGKTALITGSTRGFGYAVAHKFIEEGASVVVHGRNKDQVNDAMDKLHDQRISGGKRYILGVAVDLTMPNGAECLVNKSIQHFRKIDILVNNAGIYGAKGSVDTVNVDDWINTINTNLISVFKMCHYMIPHMKQNNYGKIINLSGGGSTAPLPNISAYATSKAAVVRLTETIAMECKDFHIDVNAIAPGALNTRLLDEILEAGESVVGKPFYEKALKQKASGGTPLELGADLCAYLASDVSNGITGKLISAQWDKWNNLHKVKDELMASDVYTLKRIIAKDRNKSWDVEE